ncbi:MAG TPA: LacI family DNA-binding transcriptional regulator [Aggregatilineales bacterium]|nr:LacI family DNA-binding transcriptional regulator [Aggregatilineales bacterium]
MSALREVAQRANVSLLTAYNVLSNAHVASITNEIRQAVLDSASNLNYHLNITIKDVAAQAEVSIATVSYVLNNSVPVSAPTRERVLEAAAALNYRPNITARNLQASETRMIGYAWHEVPPGQMNPVMDRFIYCMALAAESAGYHVLTFTQPRKNETRAYEDLIRSNRVDGFVLSNLKVSDKRIPHLIDMGVPFAAFGRSNNQVDFPFVDVDGRYGIRTCMEHLFERGHEKIAYLGWSLVDERVHGYFDALHSAGIKRNPEWVVRTHDTLMEAGNAVHPLIDLPEKERPTAIVCASDMMAIGVMRFLGSVGLRVGIDIAITGFDDHPMSEFLYPSLTTIRQPIEWLAQKVIDLLLAEINKVQLPERHIIVPPELIVRGSSSQYFAD